MRPAAPMRTVAWGKAPMTAGEADPEKRELEALGYRVARNTPYAGGYTTEHYGRPARRTHALQIEINRALYLDEATLIPNSGFGRLKRDLEQLTRALARCDWSALRTG